MVFVQLKVFLLRVILEEKRLRFVKRSHFFGRQSDKAAKLDFVSLEQLYLQQFY